MGIIDIHHVNRMLANGLSASLHVCLVLLYLYVVYRLLAAFRVCLSVCMPVCMCVLYFCILKLVRCIYGEYWRLLLEDCMLTTGGTVVTTHRPLSASPPPPARWTSDTYMGSEEIQIQREMKIQVKILTYLYKYHCITSHNTLL